MQKLAANGPQAWSVCLELMGERPEASTVTERLLLLLTQLCKAWSGQPAPSTCFGGRGSGGQNMQTPFIFHEPAEWAFVGKGVPIGYGWQ